MNSLTKPFQNLACLFAISIIFMGCGTVTSVKEYLVEMSVAGGEIITEKASMLANALTQAYKRLFPEVVDGVTVDTSNPLKGIYNGIFRVDHKIFEDGKLTIEFSWKFDNPPMRRKTEESDWEIDYEALPAELRSNFKTE